MKIKKIISSVLMTVLLSCVGQAGQPMGDKTVSCAGDAVFAQLENDQRTVFLGGQTVGIALYTKGLFVSELVSPDEKQPSPAETAGIRVGDYLLKLNGITLDSIEALDRALKKEKTLTFTVLRNGQEKSVTVIPAYSSEGVPILGMWLRDSAAGVGTVTFTQPESLRFAALGHAIQDKNGKEPLIMRDGRAVSCVITGIEKGTKGTAGELKGSFGVDAKQLGVIEQNTASGLYGTLYGPLTQVTVPLAYPDEVSSGEALLYSDFAGSGVQAYKVQILRINRQSTSKNMTVRIVDDRMLASTGGIVQGLSGSPVIQNGKLIGAITHVLVDDPTTGYAIFAENMLETAQSVSEQQLKEAS